VKQRYGKTPATCRIAPGYTGLHRIKKE